LSVLLKSINNMNISFDNSNENQQIFKEDSNEDSNLSKYINHL